MVSNLTSIHEDKSLISGGVGGNAPIGPQNQGTLNTDVWNLKKKKKKKKKKKTPKPKKLPLKG